MKRRKHAASPQTVQRTRPDDLSARERFSAIIEEFAAQGGNTSQVARVLKERFRESFPREEWSRERIYAELRAGIVGGYIEVKNLRSDLGTRLLERHGLRSAEVITSVSIEHVAALAARQLMGLLGEFRGNSECSIGFASGFAMSRVVRALAILIPHSALEFPRRVQFHALSSSFDVTNLHHDACFFLARLDEAAIRERFPEGVKFIGLHSALVPGDEYGVQRAKDKAKNIDIVVTGASDFKDPHSALKKFYDQNPGEHKRLEQLNCVGHMLYQPLGPEGPIGLKRLRMPAALDLTDLQDLVRKGKRVMLVSGPQFKTFEAKRIVATILDQEKRLVTDIVIDETTARYAVKHTRTQQPALSPRDQSPTARIPQSRRELERAGT